MAKILVAEDDTNANKLICAVLRRAGHDPLSVRDGQEALDALDKNHVDLIVTDVMMPCMDGVQLTKMLRDASWDTPILILTAKQGQEALREGFLAGADDYLVKPADMGELVLRVAALLRRSGATEGGRLAVGAAVLDPNNLSVERGSESITLPPKEFQLLYKLLSHPGHAFTRMQLLDEIWGWDTKSAESTVNVHVNRLRTRFSGWGDFKIETVRGIGYRAIAGDGQ
ncbi:response regulator transcription factor [Rubneribacter sp.]|nr:response regulator transcription factor [Candidatus Rubneribacter avistercoris]